MARMVRKQIVIEPEQEAALEERARALGVSQSELIRRAIDALLVEEERAARREAAWELLKSEFERADREGWGSEGRRWTREELHERGGTDRH